MGSSNWEDQFKYQGTYTLRERLHVHNPMMGAAVYAPPGDYFVRRTYLSGWFGDRPEYVNYLEHPSLPGLLIYISDDTVDETIGTFRPWQETLF